MRQSIRVTTVALAGALALSALAAPAAAQPADSHGGLVNALNDAKVCTPINAKVIEAVTASPQNTACGQKH